MTPATTIEEVLINYAKALVEYQECGCYDGKQWDSSQCVACNNSLVPSFGFSEEPEHLHPLVICEKCNGKGFPKEVIEEFTFVRRLLRQRGIILNGRGKVIKT